MSMMSPILDYSTVCRQCTRRTTFLTRVSTLTLTHCHSPGRQLMRAPSVRPPARGRCLTPNRRAPPPTSASTRVIATLVQRDVVQFTACECGLRCAEDSNFRSTSCLNSAFVVSAATCCCNEGRAVVRVAIVIRSLARSAVAIAVCEVFLCGDEWMCCLPFRCRRLCSPSTCVACILPMCSSS